MTTIKYYLKLLSIPLSFLALYLSLSIIWIIFNLPSPEELANIVKDLFGTYGLPVLFFSSIIESMLLLGGYFPGVFVIFISVIVATSIKEAIVVVTVATIGLLIGHSLSYFLGRYGWYNLLVKLGLKSSVDKAQANLIKKGPIAIFLSYWLPSAGALTDTAAGIIKMNYRRFLTYSIISSIFWNSLVGALVYILGNKALVLAAPGAQGDFVIYLIITIWIAVLVLGDFRGKRKSQEI
jgi:membrane protein DedA with SNARE-associated domain